MLMIGANAGIVGMTKEHLGLALALSVPIFVVVTKIDMCPPNVLQVMTSHILLPLPTPPQSCNNHALAHVYSCAHPMFCKY